MNILQLVGFILASVILIMLVKQAQNDTIAVLIRMATATIILIFAVTQLDTVFQTLNDLARKINLESTYLIILFKIVGVAYIAEFGTQLCKDAGENALCATLQLAAKIIIFTMSIPIIAALMDLVANLLH
jgi:stage III sporulation protein AD